MVWQGFEATRTTAGGAGVIGSRCLGLRPRNGEYLPNRGTDFTVLWRNSRILKSNDKEQYAGNFKNK